MRTALLMGRRAADEPSWRDEAAQILRAFRDRRLGGRRAGARIPAYLVIGPPGMGKSALIARSGLRLDPPLEVPSSHWWIGEDALFIEVAGEAERDGRHPVLPLLRALRPTVPVSGIIMVLSPADLTLADIAERVEMSGAITRFMVAFEARFHYAPPVYVAVSKLDLTPGFSEFFDRLEPSEREQPWGFTLPVELGDRARIAQGPAARGEPRSEAARAGEPVAGAAPAARPPESADVVTAYRAGFGRLLDSIRARVTQWISPETDPLQCARIVGFGAQVAALEAILKPIVEPLMPAGDRRWAGAWLRGVYLSSTQQDALAIDVLLPDMAKRFALPRSGTRPPDLGLDDEALGYFVEGIFRRVILPEAGLAMQRHPGLRTATIRGWLLTTAAIMLCAGLGVASLLSYQDGVARLAGINAAVGPLESGLTARDPAALPAVLTALDGLAVLGGDGGAVRAMERLPVLSLDYYAEWLVAQGIEPLYARALVNSLSPHLGYRLARDLIRFDAPSADLRTALAAANRTDAGGYRRWLDAGGGVPTLAPGARAALGRHGLAALRDDAVPATDKAYADVARGILDVRGEKP